jgi:hypothetical protein
MSWDAALVTVVDGQDVALPGCDWNYTHNTNGMIAAVLREAGQEIRHWWDALDGRPAAEGARLLDAVLAGLVAAPERFRAMNPANGWGNYDQLVGLLRKMCDAARKWPSAVWRISG